MQINFETLFEQVDVDAESRPMLDQTELAGELLELIRDAKLNGVTGSQLVEFGFIELKKGATNEVVGGVEASQAGGDTAAVDFTSPPEEVAADLLPIADSNPSGSKKAKKSQQTEEEAQQIADEISADNGFEVPHTVTLEESIARLESDFEVTDGAWASTLGLEDEDHPGAPESEQVEG